MKTSILVLIAGFGIFVNSYSHAQGQEVILNPNSNSNYTWQGSNQNAPTVPNQVEPIMMDPNQTANQPMVTNPNPNVSSDTNEYNANTYDKGGKRCGNFGAMGCTGTEVTNQAAGLLTTVSETAAAVKLGNDSAARKQELTNKIQSGIVVQNKDFNDVTRANIDQGVTQHKVLGSQQLTTGATQTTLAVLHANSASKLKKQLGDKEEDHAASLNEYKRKQRNLNDIINKQNNIIDQAQMERDDAIRNDDKVAQAAADRKMRDAKNEIDKAESLRMTNEAEKDTEVTEFNKFQREITAEIAKQEEVAGASTLGATQSIMKGSQHLIEASGMQGMKAAITDVENTNNGTGQFTYTPQNYLGGDEGNLTNTPTVETAGVTTDDPSGGLGLDGGIKDFNPNIGSDGAMGPAPGAFKEGAMAGGGGQGSGLGGAGGTSASRGDGGGEGAPSGGGKAQTGGLYSSSENAGTKFSRSGSSGAGVGFSSGLSDLLKKMLPGSDDKKEEKASLDLGSDRSPASDQAAVIGRNKNIFIEISKRYQKKNSEKAVYFQ